MAEFTKVAIIGAGPYALSLAAHLARLRVSHAVIGHPMDTWQNMPEGMLLKSDGFASNLVDPDLEFTLERFCIQRGLPYAPIGVPVPLETFVSYGLTFQQRYVPHLIKNIVTGLERSAEGF